MILREWLRGGVRYVKLSERVPAFLAPAEIHAFFIGIRKGGGLFQLINPFTPLQREYVIAATSDGVYVLRLRRPGVFRAEIAAVEFSGAAEASHIEGRTKSLWSMASDIDHWHFTRGMQSELPAF